jgi:predicted transcriptional regulator
MTKRRRSARRRATATPLETFIRARGIKPADLARESGYSRQHLLRVRQGQMEPTRRCIASVVAALRRLTGRAVRAERVFDLTTP